MLTSTRFSPLVTKDFHVGIISTYGLLWQVWGHLTHLLSARHANRANTNVSYIHITSLARIALQATTA